MEDYHEGYAYECDADCEEADRIARRKKNMRKKRKAADAIREKREDEAVG